MKIAICGSMSFAKEMIETKKELEKNNNEVIVPKESENYLKGKISEQDKWEKLEFDVFKDYFNEIKSGDSILVINKTKKGIRGYIGGNSLIEMAFAHVLNKKIFLLDQIPEMDYKNEIEAMSPEIINGDLSLIK